MARPSSPAFVNALQTPEPYTQDALHRDLELILNSTLVNNYMIACMTYSVEQCIGKLSHSPLPTSRPIRPELKAATPEQLNHLAYCDRLLAEVERKSQSDAAASNKLIALCDEADGLIKRTNELIAASGSAKAAESKKKGKKKRVSVNVKVKA